jgi:polyphosphate kinase
MLFLAAVFALPVPATAHPHVFVQAEVTLVFDANGDLSIKLDWHYDDLFSLLVTSDLGLDMDGDLALTAAEQVVLDEQITAWPPDYTGDLEVAMGGALLPLGPKFDHSMTYEGGLFTERHSRPVQVTAAPDAPLTIRVFDPSFYVAYDLRGPVTVQGRDDCTVQIIRADVDAAYAMAESLLDGQDPAEVGPDDYFPAIGDAFADTIEVSCARPL